MYNCNRMNQDHHRGTASGCPVAAWMPLAGALERTLLMNRSGVNEFEASRYLTDETVVCIRTEIDYYQ